MYIAPWYQIPQFPPQDTPQATAGPCKKDFSVSRFLWQLVVGFCIKISVAASSGWIHNSDKQIDLSGKCKLNLATLWSLTDPPTGLPQRSIFEKKHSSILSLLQCLEFEQLRQTVANKLWGQQHAFMLFSIFTFILFVFTLFSPFSLSYSSFHFHTFTPFSFSFSLSYFLFQNFSPFSLSCFSFSPEYSHFPPCTSER